MFPPCSKSKLTPHLSSACVSSSKSIFSHPLEHPQLKSLEKKSIPKDHPRKNNLAHEVEIHAGDKETILTYPQRKPKEQTEQAVLLGESLKEQSVRLPEYPMDRKLYQESP